MESFFSLLFLIGAYFLTSLALVQGYIPFTNRMELTRAKKSYPLSYLRKIMGISILIASFLALIMFYFFIYSSEAIS
ncbi:hypothetical protein P872_15495 [Rhodonellum psychrophilum GCM71 = DSM 17998]|uniref:Uncharacterized protein n=2 Tax=Rhodonellum TaxID=336827 RepID=U5C5H6_9BACT|nr:hypothetical protein P872_15495 [Rhodonellum psychrophilum GCM71 = DSM 17998]SDZ19367.1 hypothetical protein SAMN05444412_107127 [Rhodonellum ikkaensis]